MKEKILENLENPKQLEKLYQDNPTTFKKNFNLVFADIKQHQTAQIWNERLNFENESISWGSNNELIFIIIASFIAGLIAKIPAYTPIKEDFFYTRNLAFIVFPMLICYFQWKHKLPSKNLKIAAFALIVSVLYINLLPDSQKSDTLILACIHLPLFLWGILGYTFIGNSTNYEKRLDFLRYNGDLVVMTTLILITGGILTGITIGLFSLIDIKVEELYAKYIVVWGLSAAPIVGTYLVQTNPQLVNKVSPIIAKVFTPLVMITLVVYLFAIISSGKDPYNDREFLLLFNLLLIGVMALILFSIAETDAKNKLSIILLFGLSTVTIIINGIALSAILFRILAMGFTPNRLAVLGSNILILTNLLLVAYSLFKTAKNSEEIEAVEKSIASFLPIYSVWTMIVVFIFPLLFGFK